MLVMITLIYYVYGHIKKKLTFLLIPLNNNIL